MPSHASIDCGVNGPLLNPPPPGEETPHLSPSQGECLDRRDGLRVFGDMVYTFIELS